MISIDSKPFNGCTFNIFQEKVPVFTSGPFLGCTDATDTEISKSSVDAILQFIHKFALPILQEDRRLGSCYFDAIDCKTNMQQLNPMITNAQCLDIIPRIPSEDDVQQDLAMPWAYAPESKCEYLKKDPMAEYKMKSPFYVNPLNEFFHCVASGTVGSIEFAVDLNFYRRRKDEIAYNKLESLNSGIFFVASNQNRLLNLLTARYCANKIFSIPKCGADFSPTSFRYWSRDKKLPEGVSLLYPTTDVPPEWEVQFSV